MSNSTANSPESFSDVLAEFLHRTDQGDALDVDAWCETYPQWAENLRELAEGLEMFSPRTSAHTEADRFTETAGNSHAAAQTEFELPTMIDRYQLIRRLGSGAMGTVYLAQNTQLRRQVAVKIPHHSRHPKTNSQPRFAREVQTLARLQHPNICRVDDAGEDKGIPFLAMEYIDGRSLTQCIGHEGYREPKRIAELVQDVAHALAYVHGCGIVHRDVKPGNILIRPNGIPCITDFGLARLLDVPSEPRLTQYGTTLGTPEYMAPEQLNAEHRDIGPSCDVYALGVVLFELLTEQLPFNGPVAEMTVQIVSVPPPSPSGIRADVPPELESLCLRMLAKHPSERPASMNEVIRDLDRFLGQVSTINPDPITPNANRFRCHVNSKRIVLTLGLVIGMLSVGWWWTNQSNPSVSLPSPPKQSLDDQPFEKVTEPEPFPKFMFPIGDRNSLDMEFVRIPPGRFRMGRIQSDSPGPDNESPVDVEISYEFFAATTEVTQSQYAAICMSEPWRGYEKTIMHPDTAAAYVSWFDCCEFCDLLTIREQDMGLIPSDMVYRLPTEAEWEYFCRAGTDTLFSFGNDPSQLSDYAWWNANTDMIHERYAHRVAQHQPNPWGLYDVHGNVYEWCADRYVSRLPGGRDPYVKKSGNPNRPNRGGSWGWRDEWSCRSSNRRNSTPYARENTLGMRIVLAPPLP